MTYADTKPSEGFTPQLIRVIFHNSSAAPGEGFKVDLHWQNVGDEPAQTDYWIMAQFVPDPAEPGTPDNPGFSWDFPPARDTSLWQTGFVVKEEGCYFRVPADIPTGRYAVLISLFDRAAPDVRIPLQNKTRDVGGKRYRVGQVNVVAERGLPPKVLAYRLVWRVREPRPAPTLREPVFVSHGRLSVGFDTSKPAVRAWRLGGRDLPLGGDEALNGPEAEFITLADGKRHTSLALGADWVFQCRISGDVAVYKCRLRWRQAEVARFDLRFHVDRTSLRVRLSAVQESPGFQVMSVTLPAAVSVPETADGAALAIPSRGGRLVDLTGSGRHRQVHRLNWEDPLPGAMTVCDEAIGLAWVRCADDRLVSEVSEAQCKRGSLGIRFTTRLEGPAGQTHLIARKNSELEVTALTGAKKLDWTDGAALIAKNFRSRPNSLYIGSLIYRFDCSGYPDAKDACASALRLIRRVHALTEGAGQIIYMEGCQLAEPVHRNALSNLQSVAGQLSCTVGLVDPVDNSCPKAVADDPELLRSAVNWLASAGIAETVALSGPSFQQGLCGEPPVIASAEENISGARLIVDALRDADFDISAGPLISPLIGAMTHYWDMDSDQAGGPYSSESRIPLVAFSLHGRITYGTSVPAEAGVAQALLYGATWAEHWTEKTSDKQISERYYLVTLPWGKTAGSVIAEYAREGDMQRVVYDGGDTVEANLETGEYRVIAGGYQIGRNGLASVPVGRHRLAVYSASATAARIPLPPAWPPGSRVRAEVLSSDGARNPLEVTLQGAVLVLDVPGGAPVIIYRR